jgi:hypothetical protein
MWSRRLLLVRVALIAQAAILLVGNLGTRDYATTFRHPIGSIYYVYWWSTRASFVMFALVFAGLFATGRPASIRLWICVVLAVLSLFMVWMTELATVSLVYGDYWG